MSPVNSYQKFKSHLKSGGLFYAFIRGIKFSIFLARREIERLQKRFEKAITKGKIKIAYSENGINIFYDGRQITKDTGLNVSINSLGSWSDSINAYRKFLKKGPGSFKIKISFKNLCIDQIWTIAIEDSKQISWQIEMKIKKPVHIDEICISCSLAARYKTWFNNYQQNDFPVLNNQWQDLCLDDTPTSLLGVRFPTGIDFSPSLMIEFRDTNLLPLIKNSPLSSSFHFIGVRHTEFKARSKCVVGNYSIFSGKIYLFEDDYLLDAKMERSRKGYLDEATKKVQKEQEQKQSNLARPLKVICVNLPWQRDGRWGVRAGSRWPHIKDQSEGDYLPFPFFLAYATSLLQRNGVDATLIDAIAAQIPEDKFLEMVLGKDFDYLIAETSIPSFDNDLRILKRISGFGLPVILCGPNYEIYRPEFLKNHSFLDMVLYGEYEFGLLELMKCTQGNKDLSSVKGLIYRDSEKIVKTPPREPFDINLLPWPHRDELPIYKYLDAPGEMLTPCAQIIASRGCPFKCQFCLWPQVIYQGRHYRARNTIDVINEMEYLVKNKGFKSVYFDDDTFNIGKERMMIFCREIIRRRLNKVQWAIMARPDLMDEELLKNFRKAGLYSVKYGVESAVQGLVDGIGKAMDLKKTEKMILLTKKMGIKTHLTFTFGLPGETWQTIQETIEWAKNLNPFSVQFSIVTPFPGTEYYDVLEQKGLIISKDFSCYDGHSKSVIKLENLSPTELEAAKSRAYEIWFEHQKRQRGFLRKIKRFYYYSKCQGLTRASYKTIDYLKHALSERNHPLQPKRITCQKDILFIQCPPWDIAMPPLGVAFLSSHLKEQGYRTSVFDLNINLYNLVKEDVRFLWEQKSFEWWVDDSLFKNTWAKLKETTENLLDDILKNGETKCIGLSVNFAGINFAIELLKMIKHKNSELRIIVGGWATSDEYMRSLFPKDLFDVFVVGEGEEILPQVIETLIGNNGKKEIPGVIFTQEKTGIYNPRPAIMDLDTIPWPKFNDFDLKLYKYRILPLFTSRGCIGHCTFCNDWPYSKPYRFRSARNIFEEIEYHVRNNHISAFSFKDLLCNGNINELNSLCDLIINSGLKIGWDSQAIARKELTYDLLCKLKKSGCGSLVFGVESFSNNVLKRMGKIFTKEIAETVLKDAYVAGIAVLINIIVGFPGESEEDFQETLEAIERNHKYIRQLGAISVCLVNGRSDLDLNYNKYGIVLPSDVKIRAKRWYTLDGKNTYEIRKRRAERVIDLINKLGLRYDTCTI